MVEPDWWPSPSQLRLSARHPCAVDALIGGNHPRAQGDARRRCVVDAEETRDESGAPMSDQQIRDEVMTLFVAGHETTALALVFAWRLLAQHPEVARALHDEVRCAAVVVASKRAGTASAPSTRCSKRRCASIRRSTESHARPSPTMRLTAIPCAPGRASCCAPVRCIATRLRSSSRRRSCPRVGPRRLGSVSAPLRVFSVRRRSAHLHRCGVRRFGEQDHSGVVHRAISPAAHVQRPAGGRLVADAAPAPRSSGRARSRS